MGPVTRRMFLGSALVFFVYGAYSLVYSKSQESQTNPVVNNVSAEPQPEIKQGGYTRERFEEVTMEEKVDGKMQAMGLGAAGILAVDIDGDGKKDILLFYNEDGEKCRIRYYRSKPVKPDSVYNSHFHFEKSQDRGAIDCPKGLADIVAADFDGDNRDEIAVIAKDGVYLLTKELVRDYNNSKVVK